MLSECNDLYFITIACIDFLRYMKSNSGQLFGTPTSFQYFAAFFLLYHSFHVFEICRSKVIRNLAYVLMYNLFLMTLLIRSIVSSRR